MSDDDLDALIRRVDPDRWLSSRFVADAAQRTDLIALYAFDHELARAPKVASEPLLGEIRLTWWGEVLGEIFEGRAVRRHPTAEALATAVRRRDLPRERLEAMVEGRYRELDAEPMSREEIVRWAEATAGQAAALAAHILDRDQAADVAQAAGAAWALAIVERNGGGPHLAEPIRLALRDARSSAVSPAAFPAIAHAALAGAYAARRELSEIGKRLRLTWAVATGRI